MAAVYLYKLRVPDEVAHLLGTLHPELKRKIKGGLRIIISNPEAGKSLRDELAGLRSFRISRFRIIYRIKGRIIEIVAIGPRERIYQATYQSLKKNLS
jgi:mRNA interferase RelE/StbE